MTTPQETALKALNAKLTNANDSLYRAKAVFKRMSSDEMNKNYGTSGLTRAKVLEEYQNEVDELTASVEWIKHFL